MDDDILLKISQAMGSNKKDLEKKMPSESDNLIKREKNPQFSNEPIKGTIYEGSQYSQRARIKTYEYP